MQNNVWEGWVRKKTIQKQPMLTWKKKTFNISRLKSFEGQQTLMRQSAKVCELALKASYQVTLRVAQTKQPYIIAESLVLPAASNMWKTTFGKEEYVKKTEKHPFAFFPFQLMNWQLMWGHN